MRRNKRKRKDYGMFRGVPQVQALWEAAKVLKLGSQREETGLGGNEPCPSSPLL